jgi:hypothetical protein
MQKTVVKIVKRDRNMYIHVHEDVAHYSNRVCPWDSPLKLVVLVF